LLDYLSDFQLFTVFKALRNKDYTVCIASSVAIVLKAVLVLSTGLITLSWTLVHHDSWPMTVQDRFVDDSTRLANAGTLARVVMTGLLEHNLTYPDGMSENYAFQSVNPNLPSTAESRVTVDGLENSLERYPAYLTFRGATPDYDIYFDAPRINGSLSSPGCNIGDPVVWLPQWKCGSSDDTCTLLFARFVQTRCDGTTGDTGKRALVMFGNLTYTVGDRSTTNEASLDPARRTYITELRQSTQSLCIPTYGITKVDVVRNGTQTLSVTASPGATRQTLSSVTGWSLMEAQFATHRDSFLYGHPVMDIAEGRAELDEAIEIAVRSQFRLRAAGSITSLFEPKTLQKLAAGYYRQLAAILAKQSLMEPAAADIDGSVLMYENRLVLRAWAAHWMSGLAATCAVLAAVAGLLVPRRGFLPYDPATRPGMASLISRSTHLVAMLRFSGQPMQRLSGVPC
jgi:hypothetical protein